MGGGGPSRPRAARLRQPQPSRTGLAAQESNRGATFGLLERWCPGTVEGGFVRDEMGVLLKGNSTDCRSGALGNCRQHKNGLSHFTNVILESKESHLKIR